MIIYEPEVRFVKKEVQAINLSEAEETYKYAYQWFMKNAADITREHLILICLNNKHFVVNTQILTIGTDRQTLLQPRDVIKHVLINNCSNFILIHQHPSGDPAPSTADIRVTHSLREACRIMDINFLDHVILGERENDPMGLGYYSFRNAGHL